LSAPVATAKRVPTITMRGAYFSMVKTKSVKVRVLFFHQIQLHRVLIQIEVKADFGRGYPLTCNLAGFSTRIAGSSNDDCDFDR
jgi:hypothetical protein